MNHMTVIHRDTLSCEPILRRMPNGELLCVSQCGDVTEPAPGNRVVVFHSADEGKSWSGPTLIIPDTGEAVYLTEVTVFRDRVVVYLTLHNGAFLNWRSQRVESPGLRIHMADVGSTGGRGNLFFSPRSYSAAGWAGT